MRIFKWANLKYDKRIIILVIIALVLRTIFGLCINFAEVNTQYLQDYTQIYLIGLKFYTTEIWPYWGPDITYTFSQMPGGLQGLLVGIPFHIIEKPEAPFILLNILSTLSLTFFAWYTSKIFTGIPKWFIYAWLLTAPWTLNYSTTVINPSYVLAPAIFFFISIFEILPFYKIKILSINLSYFIIGFTLGWILQIHMSWVVLPFYILLSFYFLLKTKNYKIIFGGILFFCLGFILIMSTFLPTIMKYGFVTGGTESNIIINFSNLKNVDVISRFIAFSTFEVRHFITGGYNGEKSMLLNNLWAAPFIVILFFIGIFQTIYYILFFFKKNTHEEFKYVKLFTIGSILLIYICYIFTIRNVSSYTFYLLLPVSFWFSFYCIENLFKKLFWKKFAIFFILSGLIYHITLAKEYFPTNSLYSKKNKIELAFKNKDSRLFAYRRVANWENNERNKYWKKNIIINTNDTLISYVTGFDDFPQEILPESLNKSYNISTPFSCQIDSLNIYSIGLSKQMKDFNYKKKVSISLFIRYNEINDCVLALQLTKKDKTIFWTDEKICKDKKNLKNWNQIIINKELPANIDTSAKINIYVWLPSASSKTKIQVDDFKINFK